MLDEQASLRCAELMLEENERIDDLQLVGLRILQKTTGFRFGMDAVLLSDFARVEERDRVADFGTGTDDAGGAEVSGRGDDSGVMYPDGGGELGVILTQLGAEGQNQFLDAFQCLPGIRESGKIFPGKGMGQIE